VGRVQAGGHHTLVLLDVKNPILEHPPTNIDAMNNNDYMITNKDDNNVKLVLIKELGI